MIHPGFHHPTQGDALRRRRATPLAKRPRVPSVLTMALDPLDLGGLEVGDDKNGNHRKTIGKWRFNGDLMEFYGLYTN